MPSSRCPTTRSSSAPRQARKQEEARAGAGPARPRSFLRLDLDLAPLGALRLRSANGQNAVLQVGLDLLGVDRLRQADAVLEAAGATHLPAHRTLALAFLALARDRQLAADDLDLDILPPDTRKLGLDDI